MKMPTQLNRLFRLYAARKNVSTENVKGSSHNDSEPVKKSLDRRLTRKSSKNSRRG
jgi:hypothetical protein